MKIKKNKRTNKKTDRQIHRRTDRFTDIKSFFKWIYNPQYLPNDLFALSTFLDDLKPSHLNLSISIFP